MLIERRETAKVLLHQGSVTSIASDAIACRLSRWRAGQLPACPRGGACRSLARPRGGSVFIFLPRAACAVDQFFFFTARSLHGGNHVLLLPRSSCAVLDFNSSAAQSLRGSRPHRSAPCRPYAADVLPRRSGHEICFQSKVCTHKYLDLKLAPSTKSNAYGRTAKYCRWVLPSPP